MIIFYSGQFQTRIFLESNLFQFFISCKSKVIYFNYYYHKKFIFSFRVGILDKNNQTNIALLMPGDKKIIS